MGIYLFDEFPVQIYLKKKVPRRHGKVQDLQDGLELNGTHQLPVYADDVELSGEIVFTIQKEKEKKNTEYLLDASTKTANDGGRTV
jgi:hypothetical protein